MTTIMTIIIAWSGRFLISFVQNHFVSLQVRQRKQQHFHVTQKLFTISNLLLIAIDHSISLLPFLAEVNGHCIVVGKPCMDRIYFSHIGADRAEQSTQLKKKK